MEYVLPLADDDNLNNAIYKYSATCVINIEAIGTMTNGYSKFFAHYIRVKDIKKYKKLRPAKLPCYTSIRPVFSVFMNVGDGCVCDFE